jgi:hypothetical protein
MLLYPNRETCGGLYSRHRATSMPPTNNPAYLLHIYHPAAWWLVAALGYSAEVPTSLRYYRSPPRLAHRLDIVPRVVVCFAVIMALW